MFMYKKSLTLCQQIIKLLLDIVVIIKSDDDDMMLPYILFLWTIKKDIGKIINYFAHNFGLELQWTKPKKKSKKLRDASYYEKKL